MEATRKIFIVDDESDIINFLSYRFEKIGYQVYSATDGLSALIKLNAITPDVILLDIMMPYMNGIEVCSRLKTQERFKNTPVIFLSAVKDDFKVFSAMTSGGDHFVSKPVRFDILQSIIDEAINSKPPIALAGA